MQHVGAGDVNKRKGSLFLPGMLNDVVQVVNPIKVKRSIWIAGSGWTSGVHEMDVECEGVQRH